MNRIILFRFHKNADICANRIKILKNQNHNIPIYGVGEDINGINKLYDNGLENLHTINNKSDRWKWLNGDFVIQDWYNSKGKYIDFDICHIIEWDMILTDSIENIYSHIDIGSIGITGLKPINKVNKNWLNGRYNEINYLIDYFSKEIRYKDLEMGIFPGLSVPKQFLEDINSLDIPNIANDEIRISVLANMLDYTVKDTNLSDANSNKFNTKNNIVDVSDITDDIKAYHPVRDIVSLNQI